ncbi:protein kinase domain-containing protein [Nocardia sp. KC 131]|uniref:protein kinase domain-containing protein n=1 Tax=Nocardia arseniciresistens TaxID=3392119 RepID=UPI00398F5901
MTSDDQLRTQRELPTLLTELDAAGFEDAVEIGRGGFGVVYRCRQVALDRMVAVKVLTAELDEDNQSRFLREQRAMGRLTGHPNIVTVLEVGTTASGRPFLVMPYHPLDSLDVRIRRHGPLSAERVLWIGVKIAGALETAHRLGIVHRDVKPGNILLTAYGEPALTDFGIAHIAGGFQTAADTVTGTPAFTAPEVLEGETPTASADVYGLGATLFCALTGHAAFERRSGENVVTQFLRITTQPMPDLRDDGIADDVSALVEKAMNREPRERPSAAELGEASREVQRRRGFSTGEMALQNEPVPEHEVRKIPAPGRRRLAAVGRNGGGNLPLELTGLVDRRAELAEVKNHLSASRSVTLTGAGGVGKTRLALRAAAQAQRDFSDGVWLVELADVYDTALLVDVMAATLGVRDDSTRPLLEVLVHYLSSRETLLVLDNCEQLVEAVAELNETLLRSCPEVRILVTSREPLNTAGEAVVRVMPLSVPDSDRDTSLQARPRFDAVTLFVERAAAAVPGLELDEGNKDTVTRICARLDGVPLAIELAAARMRTMSPEQILHRLSDRMALLTTAIRTAPPRQQSLKLCIDWSYELCSPAEQRLWAQLSVFAGSCGLDAVEQVCGDAQAPLGVLDVLSSLVDKSILVREESGPVVRFRMLEMLREYGRSKLQASGEYQELRRRHRNWCRRLALDAEAGWISSRQPDWVARLTREQPNLREALECSLSEDTEEAADAGLQTASALWEFWVFRGLYGEGRSWLDRVLAHPRARSIPHRVSALRVSSQLATSHGDFPSAASLLEQGRTLAEQAPTPMAQAQMDHAAGALALGRGEPALAASFLERAIEVFSSDRTGHLHVHALNLLGWTYELRGDTSKAIVHQRNIISITEECGELFYRSLALRGMGVAEWRRGDTDRAQELLEQALRVDKPLSSSIVMAFGLEALAWIASDRNDIERAAVLMGAARELWPVRSSLNSVFDNLSRFHEGCEKSARRALGTGKFEAAFQRGRAMDTAAARAYALGEQGIDTAPATDPTTKLTKRERQVALLIAQGLSNKQIASELFISPRTAQGHVEHILTKLGFTSRAQVAVWIVDQANQGSSRQ